MRFLDYLFYKVYRATLKGAMNDVAEFAATVYVAGLLFMNILALGAFLKKTKLLPIFFQGTGEVVWFILILIATSFLYFFSTKRYKTIVAEFESENEKQRKKGNIIIWIYLIVSIALVFAVALYKSGVL